MDKVYEFVNSPWFQMLAPIAGAYLGYRFPKQSGAVVNVMAMILGALQRPAPVEEKKA